MLSGVGKQEEIRQGLLQPLLSRDPCFRETGLSIKLCKRIKAVVMASKIITKQQTQLLNAFMEAAKDDPRIGTGHISLYLSLIGIWGEKKFENPLSVFSHEIMPLCKIAGSATYHRSIKELHEYGYIQYTASYNHFLGSLVYFVPIAAELPVTHKRIFMSYFLLPGGDHCKIMKVHPEDVENFRKKYQRQVMLEAESIAELLILFSERMEERRFQQER